LASDDTESKGDHDLMQQESFKPSHQSRNSGHTAMVWNCSASLWVNGIIGSYCFWLGFAAPKLNGNETSLLLTILGFFGLSLFVITVGWLSIYGVMEAEKLPITTFRAFGVPMVPSFAILCNFLLMAQYDAWTHVYLGLFIFVSLVGYIGYRFTRP
jgi:hypothetical protein